jgi:hypothetical protein
LLLLPDLLPLLQSTPVFLPLRLGGSSLFGGTLICFDCCCFSSVANFLGTVYAGLAILFLYNIAFIHTLYVLIIRDEMIYILKYILLLLFLCKVRTTCTCACTYEKQIGRTSPCEQGS